MKEQNSAVKHSRIMLGWVRHRRFEPKPHDLQYPVFMWFIDLDEISSVTNQSRLFKLETRAWLSFKRADYFGESTKPLKAAVIEKIAQHSDVKPEGIHRVRMLTNVRTLGYAINPVTFYYAYDKHDQLISIMPEITNTPWNERFQYVLNTQNTDGGIAPVSVHRNRFRYKLNKSFHISPFHPMNMQYDWRFTMPSEKSLFCHLENWQQGEKIFDATLSLKPEPITAQTIRSTLIRFPWMTVKVATGIYWNALKLWLKGVPFYSHPNKSKKEKLS